MKEDGPVHYHFPEAHADLGRAAEDERVDETCIGADFPKEQEKNKDQRTGNADGDAMPFQRTQEHRLFA